MADPESTLKNALCTVSVHADSVWWHEAKDKYRLANLNLWLHVLRTRNQPAEPQPEYRHDRSAYRCPRRPPQEMELPEEMIPDPEAWLKGHSWPTAIARNFPALSVALIGDHACRGVELLSEQNLPYRIETSDELKLYRRTCNESVRGIWLNLKPQANDLNLRRRDSSPSGNVGRPDYCAPVLQLQRGSGNQPIYPAMTDHNYQAELFPYHDHGNGAEQEHQQWQAAQQAQQTPQNAQPHPTADCYGEWRGRQGSLLVLQRSSAHRPQRLQRCHLQQAGLQQQFQPQPILLSSDFPELPNRGNEQSVPPAQMRRPFLPDPGNFTERLGQEIPELQAWVQTVYPQRAAQFSKMAALASWFEEVARRINSGQEVPPQADVQQLLVQAQACPEGRRLYRDVVASKAVQREDSETNMEVKFEELEREALEQYINSQNDNEEEPDVEDLCPEEEEKFLDLERQAIEQYEEQVELEEQPVIEEEVSKEIPMEDCSAEVEVIQASAEASPSNKEEEDVLPATSSDPQEAAEEGESVPGEPSRSASLPAQEVQQPWKAAVPKSAGRHRGRKEPAPAPSCARLPRHQVVRAAGHDKCEKGSGSKAGRPSRSTPPGCQEGSCRAGQDSLKKAFYKKKEASPEVKRRLRYPPLTVVDQEVKALANSLRSRALSFLKDVDVKMLTEDQGKLALRELLYKGPQKEIIRKEVRVSDIQDTDTLRLYVREILGLARMHMQTILRRVRDEVIEMTSRKTIYIPQPTTAEKRKVRYLIKKCLELMEKAESLKKLPKKPLESSKKEITAALGIIHKSMDAVYQLRDMCRETYEDMTYLRSSLQTTVELVVGQSHLGDKSDYIRRRVEVDKLPLLLYCLFPRRESILFDRTMAQLECEPPAIYLSSAQHALNNTLLISHQTCPRIAGLKEARMVNRMTQDRPRRKDLWSEDTWERSLVIGGLVSPVRLFVAGRSSIYDFQTVMSNKVLTSKSVFGPRSEVGHRSGETPLRPPRKRGATRSDPELQSKQQPLPTDRGYWTWPKTCKTSNLLRLLKAQPKQRKKPLRNDSGCSIT